MIAPMVIRRMVALIAAITGVALIVVAFWYWIGTSRTLPEFLPAYDPNGVQHHGKHGVAAFILSLASLWVAWRASRPPARSGPPRG
jgi:hypothetical protein